MISILDITLFRFHGIEETCVFRTQSCKECRIPISCLIWATNMKLKRKHENMFCLSSRSLLEIVIPRPCYGDCLYRHRCLPSAAFSLSPQNFLTSWDCCLNVLRRPLTPGRIDVARGDCDWSNSVPMISHLWKIGEMKIVFFNKNIIVHTQARLGIYNFLMKI